MGSDPDVFAYLDYRQFLRDLYLARKAEGGFSYRIFSQRAGLRSPNYLKLVIDGERNLSAPMAARFAEACQLEGSSAAYFEGIVSLDQARDPEERRLRYASLSRFRRFREIHRLDLAQDAYHSRWYLPAIRELVALPFFEEDPAWIASRLQPPIRAREAAEALTLLLELRLLERDARGRLRQVDATVSTGPEVPRSAHVASYHRAMMQRASDAIDQLPRGERELTAVTLCVGEGGFERLRQRLAELRRELLDLAELEAAPGQVVHLGLQLVALTRVPSDSTPKERGSRR